MRTDPDRCRYCGLCLDVCPTGALTAELAPQTEEDLALEEVSRKFNESVN